MGSCELIVVSQQASQVFATHAIHSIMLARCTAFAARNRWLGHSQNPSITYPSQSKSQIQFGKSNRYVRQSIPPERCSRLAMLADDESWGPQIRRSFFAGSQE